MATLGEMTKTNLLNIIIDHLVWFCTDGANQVSFDSLLCDVDMTEDDPGTLRAAIEEYQKRLRKAW